MGPGLHGERRPRFDQGSQFWVKLLRWRAIPPNCLHVGTSSSPVAPTTAFARWQPRRAVHIAVGHRPHRGSNRGTLTHRLPELASAAYLMLLNFRNLKPRQADQSDELHRNEAGGVSIRFGNRKPGAGGRE